MKTIKALAASIALSFSLSAGGAGYIYHGNFETEVDIKTSNATTYTTRASMNGGQTYHKYLVDTGASFNTITRSDIKNLKGARYLRDVRITLADGSIRKAKAYMIPEMLIGGHYQRHCFVKDVVALVIGDNQDNILGMSALKKLAPFALDVPTGSVNGSLLLSNCIKATPVND